MFILARTEDDCSIFFFVSREIKMDMRLRQTNNKNIIHWYETETLIHIIPNPVLSLVHFFCRACTKNSILSLAFFLRLDFQETRCQPK